MHNNKKGSAIGLCLVFCSVMLVLGLAYAKMVSNSKSQTDKIDDVIRFDYVANDIFEKAILKYQLYPADFYAYVEAQKNNNNSYLYNWCVNDNALSIPTSIASSSFLTTQKFSGRLASVTLLTDNRWNSEVLRLEVEGSYFDIRGQKVEKKITKLVNLTRNVNSDF